MRNYLFEANLLPQIICSIKIRWAPTRHDNMDFKPIITRISEIVPLSLVTSGKAWIMKIIMY